MIPTVDPGCLLAGQQVGSDSQEPINPRTRKSLGVQAPPAEPGGDFFALECNPVRTRIGGAADSHPIRSRSRPNTRGGSGPPARPGRPDVPHGRTRWARFDPPGVSRGWRGLAMEPTMDRALLMADITIPTVRTITESTCILLYFLPMQAPINMVVMLPPLRRMMCTGTLMW